MLTPFREKGGFPCNNRQRPDLCERPLRRNLTSAKLLGIDSASICFGQLRLEPKVPIESGCRRAKFSEAMRDGGVHVEIRYGSRC